MEQTAQSFIFRLCIDLIILIMIFTLPWWVSLVSIVVAICYFKRFYEALVGALIIDIFFGLKATGWYGFTFWATVGIGIVFFAIQYIKTRLRYYGSKNY